MDSNDSVFPSISSRLRQRNVQSSFFQERHSPAVGPVMKDDDVSAGSFSADSHSSISPPSDTVQEAPTSQLSVVSSSLEAQSESEDGSEDTMATRESEEDSFPTRGLPFGPQLNRVSSSPSVDSLMDALTSSPVDPSNQSPTQSTQSPTQSTQSPTQSTNPPMKPTIPILPFDSHYLLVFFTTIELFGKTVSIMSTPFLETSRTDQEHAQHV